MSKETTSNVGTAFKAPRVEENNSLSSSQSSEASEGMQSDLSQTLVAEVRDQVPVDPPLAVPATTGIAAKLNNEVPADFGGSSALDLLATDVPAHIKDRWQIINKDCNVQELFGTNARANQALDGLALQVLLPLTGETEYNRVNAKTTCKVAPNLGLWEIFSMNKIHGRTSRARSKGLMFFYLMCCNPDAVVFPEFQVANKRRRSSPFTLAEIGRLVAIIADKANRSLVSMLFKKWTRAELDARAGNRGQSYYWTQLAERYNNNRYKPDECQAFADHVKSCSTGAIYSTHYLPELRSGDQLKTAWGVLRANYALFYSKYTRSGHNEPDPCAYTNDLQVLLMHWTFDDTDMVSWAAKSMVVGALDDAGDGDGAAAAAAAKGPTKRKKTFTADKILAGVSMYEAIFNAPVDNMTEDELCTHIVRRKQVASIVDVCLTSLNRDLGC